YWSRQDLASSYVHTPDPKKNSQEFGQRIRMYWNVSLATFEKGELALQVHVRLKNGEEYNNKFILTEAHGSMLYPILGKDYHDKGGLLSYHITLESEGHKIAERRHKFWVDHIDISDVE